MFIALDIFRHYILDRLNVENSILFSNKQELFFFFNRLYGKGGIAQ